MDALDLLEQQHQELRARLDQVTWVASPGRRATLVTELVRTLDAHARAEELVFYAAFAGRVGGEGGRLYEAVEDRGLLRFAATNLLRTRVTDVRFDARLKLVQRLFRRHAATEESWLFPRAKRTFHDEALDRLGFDLERAYAVRLAVKRT